MWTLTQLSPRTETVGVFETFAEIKAKVSELSRECDSTRSDGDEAVYFTLADGRQYEAYHHG
jgi:hypothetical protein